MDTVTPFVAAGGSVDITPRAAVPLSGYSARTAPYRGVRDSLEANALWLRSGDDQLLLLQIDALSVGQELRSRVLASLAGSLRDEQLLTVASHTHFAPAIDPALPDLGAVDAGYLGFVSDRLCGLATSLAQGPWRPCRLRYGSDAATAGVNRRGRGVALSRRPPFVIRDCFAMPNVSGPRDDRLQAVLADLDGAAPAALWSYACHPVALPDRLAVSAEYPGAVRVAIRARYGADAPVVYLPGFGGDQRPRLIAERLSWSSRLRSTLNGPWFQAPSETAYGAWCAEVAETALRALGSAGPLEGEGIRCRRETVPMADLTHGWQGERHLAVQAVRLGGLRIAALGAEPVIEYGRMLREAGAPEPLLAVGYLDGVVGYLPTTAMLPEGGIEVRSPGYGFAGARYSPEAEPRVRAALLRMLGEVG